MAINWFDTDGNSKRYTYVTGAGTDHEKVHTDWTNLGLDAAGTALNTFQGFAKYKSAKAEAKAREAWQKYHNTMVNLSNATQQNGITMNEIFAQQALADQALQIKRGDIISSGSVEANAAAAGVTGNSVALSMLDVKRNSAQAEYKRQVTFKNTMLAFDTQRTNAALAAVMQGQHSYIPQPNAASYILSGMFGG